jgi:hypothetical protein
VAGPINEGEHRIEVGSCHEIAPKYQMRFGNADRLSQFEEYQFFTPALLYIYGRFNDRPLLDFMQETKQEVRLMHRLFNQPIFRGFHTPDGNTDWCRALWAVERTIWDAFENFMLSVVMSEASAGCVYGAGSQDVQIVDPLAIDRSVIISVPVPALDIVVFGVDGSNCCVAVDHGPATLMCPPTVRIHPPQLPMQRYAAALFSGDNPVLAKEQPE